MLAPLQPRAPLQGKSCWLGADLEGRAALLESARSWTTPRGSHLSPPTGALKTPLRSTPGKLGTGSRCEARSTVHGTPGSVLCQPGSPASPRRFHAPLCQVSSGQELAASPQPFCPGSPVTDTAAVSSPGLCRRRREGRARALGVSAARARVQRRGDARSPPTAAAHLGPPGGGLEGNGSRRQRRRQTGFIQGQTGAEIQTPAAQQQMQQRTR